MGPGHSRPREGRLQSCLFWEAEEPKAGHQGCPLEVGQPPTRCPDCHLIPKGMPLKRLIMRPMPDAAHSSEKEGSLPPPTDFYLQGCRLVTPLAHCRPESGPALPFSQNPAHNVTATWRGRWEQERLRLTKTYHSERKCLQKRVLGKATGMNRAMPRDRLRLRDPWRDRER